MKYDIKNCKGKFAVHCRTEKEAKTFCRYLDSLGRRWRNGSSYLTETNWDYCKENTCYAFNEGCFDDINCFDKDGYKIIEFSNFEWDEMTKPAFKVGDRVRCIKSYDGNDKIVNKNGRIIEISPSKKDVTVEFDELIGGHSGIDSSKGKKGHCWTVPVEYLVPETSEDYEINVGDYVTVVNNGMRYSSYAEWVTKNTPEYAAYYAYNNSTPLSDEFLKVVAKAPHSLEKKDKMLFLVKDKVDDACYLFAEEGLRKA